MKQWLDIPRAPGSNTFYKGNGLLPVLRVSIVEKLASFGCQIQQCKALKTLVIRLGRIGAYCAQENG